MEQERPYGREVLGRVAGGGEFGPDGEVQPVSSVVVQYRSGPSRCGGGEGVRGEVGAGADAVGEGG
ncbi:hypothetical protein, partial [Streptomyces sp. NPDC018347]|uniref:hypothetical protein n=1 Tax=Streptomyces sp. NPDC018347 TaxID=3157193 RepID=UPI0033E36381